MDLAKIKKRHNIIREIGTGDFCKIFLIERNIHPAVLKVPMNGVDPKDWNDVIQREVIANQILSKYKGKVFVPKLLDVSNDYLIEELARGTELARLEKPMDQIAISDQAYEFADFLTFLHSYDTKKKNSRLNISNDFTNDEILERLEQVVDKQNFREFRDDFDFCALNPLKTDVQTFCHTDLRRENVFYDRIRKQMSVTGFGLSGITCPYTDLIPELPSHALPPEFLSKVITNYNKNNGVLQFDKEAVGKHYSKGILYDYVKEDLQNNGKGSKLKSDIENIAIPEIEKIRKSFNPFFEKTFRPRKKKALEKETLERY